MQRGGGARRDLLRPRQPAVGRMLGQRRQMLDNAIELIGDRAWIARIEHDQIDDRRARRHHDVALPVGDLAVAQFEQDIEGGARRILAGELADEAAGLDRALDAPAELEEAPARELRHVLLGESRERRDDAKRRLDPLQHQRLGGTGRQPRVDHRDQIVERPPGIGREAVADHRRGGVRGPHQIGQCALEVRRATPRAPPGWPCCSEYRLSSHPRTPADR